MEQISTCVESLQIELILNNNITRVIGFLESGEEEMF